MSKTPERVNLEEVRQRGIPAVTEYQRHTVRLVALALDELEETREENRQIRKAVGEAVVYIESMRIVTGGIRDQMRRRWRLLLGEAVN
jgi:hypothetical protein